MVDIRNINREISIGLLDLEAFSQTRNIIVKRDQEKQGTLYLLDQMIENGGACLRYTPENKPYLSQSDYHISISHSHNKLAIITNKAHSTGIDIELIRDKVLAIRHKFLNKREAEFAGENIKKLITIWSAKEAMYKAYGLKGVDFREHLDVVPFDTNEITGILKIHSISRSYRMFCEHIGDYIMVYITDEI